MYIHLSIFLCIYVCSPSFTSAWWDSELMYGMLSGEQHIALPIAGWPAAPVTTKETEAGAEITESADRGSGRIIKTRYIHVVCMLSMVFVFKIVGVVSLCTSFFLECVCVSHIIGCSVFQISPRPLGHAPPAVQTRENSKTKWGRGTTLRVLTGFRFCECIESDTNPCR